MVEDTAQALTDCRPVILSITKYVQENIPPLLQASFGGMEPPPLRVGTPQEYDDNLNNFLMYIEEAVMQFRSCLSHNSSSVHGKIPPKPERKGPVRPAELPCGELKDKDNDSDDEESGMGERPWTRTELKDKASQKIQKRRPYRGVPRAHSEE